MHSINNCNINNETARHKIEFPEKGGPKQQNGDGVNQTDQQELGTETPPQPGIQSARIVIRSTKKAISPSKLCRSVCTYVRMYVCIQYIS